MKLNQKGLSVIEVMLAAALFIIFASGSAVVILQGLDSNRLGEEQTKAYQYASEGLEAARSIKNQAFSNLANSSTVGVGVSSNLWGFSGPNNTLDNKFTRVMQVENVQRDGSGNIVASGGTVDPNTKKVISTVSWNYTPTRNNSVVLDTYLTNWKAPITTAAKNGMLVFGAGGTTSDAMRYRLWDGTNLAWGASASLADIDTGTTNKYMRAVELYNSPTRDEKIALTRHYNGSAQFIYGQVWDGTAWGNVQVMSSWSATTYLNVANFGGTYRSDGTFMVVYSDNTTIPKMRTWNGSAWSAASNVTTQTGVPVYVVLAARAINNEVMLAIFNTASDAQTTYYNGSTWSAVTTHSSTAPLATKKFIDFAWSPNDNTKGAVIYASTTTEKNIRMKIWTANNAGSGAWSAVGSSAAQTSNMGAMKVIARPGANEFLACDKDANTTPRVICYVANFTPTFTTPTNNTVAPATQNGIQPSYDVAYEDLSGGTAIAVYSANSAVPSLKKYSASTTTWDAGVTAIITTPYTLGTVATTKVVPVPGTNDIFAFIADANLDLYSVMYNGTTDAMYTTPAGVAFSRHILTGSATLDTWYDFAWDN